MKRLFILFFFLSHLLLAQKQAFNFKSAPLPQVLEKLESIYSVRFSYNSSLIKNKRVSYTKQADLQTVLNDISSNLNLEFIFLDKENIVIKALDFPDDFNNLLEEIVLVSEYITSGFDQNKKDGSVNMNLKKLGILPGLTEPDVLQSLQLLPGISSPTESAANLNIRGGTPDQNLIMYDGIRVYHQGHLFGMISPFNPYVVESVNVFRSGTSARFGERISGVIDIASINEIPQEIQGGFGANFLHTDAFVSIPIFQNKGALILSGRTSIHNLIGLPTFDLFSDKVFQNTKIEEVNNLISEEELTILNDEFRFTDFNGKFIFNPSENHRISLSSLYIKNKLNYANADQDDEGTRDELETENYGLSGLWDAKLNNNSKLKTSFRFSNYESDYRLSQLQSGSSNLSLTKTNSIRDMGIQLEWIQKLKDRTTLHLGYDFGNFDAQFNLNFLEDTDESDNQDGQLKTHTIFGELEHQKGSLFVRAGLRSTYFSSDEQLFLEPRLFANYTISENFKFKASAEVKNQAIGQLVSFEFNELGLDESIWIIAQEREIPILNNKQFTLGFEFTKNKWLLDVDFYSKKIQGLTSLTRGFSNNSQSGEYFKGTSDIIGLDVLIKKKIQNFRTWLSYSFSKNDFNFPDLKATSFAGTFDQRHILSWSNSYNWNQIQFALGWQYTSGRPFSETTRIQDDELVYEDINNQRLPSYHRLDASAMYDFYFSPSKTVKGRFGFSLINVYNRDNDIDKRFTIDRDVNNQINELTNVGLGTTVNAVFRVNF